MNAKSADIDSILDNLFLILPVFYRKLLPMDLSGVTGDLTRLHYGLMRILSEGDMTVTRLARVTMVTKPQMTHLVDQLVKQKIIERHPDAADRRVINLSLTEHGRDLLGEMKRKVRENIKESLARLTPAQLAQMARALETLRGIGDKL